MRVMLSPTRYLVGIAPEKWWLEDEDFHFGLARLFSGAS